MKIASIIFLVFDPEITVAQNEAAKLGKKLANPIASPTSNPFHNNPDLRII